MLQKYRGSSALARQCQEDMERAVSHCRHNTYFEAREVRAFGSKVLNTWIVSKQGRTVAVGTVESLSAPYNHTLYVARWATVEPFTGADGLTRHQVADKRSDLLTGRDLARNWLNTHTPKEG